MHSQHQLSTGPALLERVESGHKRMAKADLNDVEMPLEEARALVGRVVRRIVRHGEGGLKKFGDKGQVGRWCAGTENPNLAKLIQDPDDRRELLVGLARETRGATVRIVIEMNEKVG